MKNLTLSAILSAFIGFIAAVAAVLPAVFTRILETSIPRVRRIFATVLFGLPMLMAPVQFAHAQSVLPYDPEDCISIGKFSNEGYTSGIGRYTAKARNSCNAPVYLEWDCYTGSSAPKTSNIGANSTNNISCYVPHINGKSFSLSTCAHYALYQDRDATNSGRCE